MIDLPFYPLREKYLEMTDEFTAGTKEVLEDGIYIGGEHVSKFEAEFGAYQGATYCLGVGNGLDALRLSLLALGVKAGDRVAVPAFTFIATWFAVTELQAIPVPVDVRMSDAGMLIENLEELNVKGIIYVHLFGIPADLSELSIKAKELGIFLIEDCAQAHGGEVNGTKVGNFGDAGCFSFYPTKNLGAIGDGGAVITSRADLAEKISSLRTYGTSKTKYEHETK